MKRGLDVSRVDRQDAIVLYQRLSALPSQDERVRPMRP